MTQTSRPPRGSRGHVARIALMEGLGSVVYAARLADGTIKIGWTEHFGHRLRMLKHTTGQDIELLAFCAGDYDDEQAIHQGLVPHRIEGKREYYHPTTEVLEIVNAMRSDLGLTTV